jgi:hypothetical protein
VIDELLACHGCFMCDEMFVKTFLCDEMLCVMNAMATTQKHFFFVFFLSKSTSVTGVELWLWLFFPFFSLGDFSHM